MRRRGTVIRLFALVAAGLGMAGPLSSARAFSPVIAIPPHVELQPREGQPLAAFRFGGLMFAGNATPPEGGIRLKRFLTDAPILGVSGVSPGLSGNPAATSEPTAGQVLPALRVTGAPKEIPPEVASAVKLLLRKDVPDRDAPNGKPPEAADPATRAAVSHALDVLRGGSSARPPNDVRPVATPAPPPKVFDDPEREVKIAEVAKQIELLNNSLSESAAPAELIVTLAEPIAAFPKSATARTGEEEQDAVKSAVDKAISSLLQQSPEMPQNLPAAIPVVSAPLAAAPVPASCPTCGRGSGLRPLHRLGEHKHSESRCATCGGGWRCSPGHEPCEPCEAHDGPLGRMFCDFYECLCCPDPCYEPQWRQVPNAALFVDGARPVTQTEIRWTAGRSGSKPDRAEYFWARADGMGRGPRPPAGRLAEFRFDYDDLNIITETASEKLSMIVEMPYRAVSPDTYAHGAGFANVGIGTKTLLFDCELLQVSMQMKTYLPIGNALKGIGNGLVSLEPSLLFALKLHADTYVQAQISEWIPIGGDPFYAGSILHTHASLNHVLCRFGPDIPLVGTVESNTYSFQDGAYTDPFFGSFQKASDMTYISVGPGLRLFFCDKLDVGFGSAFSLTSDNFARQTYRTSVRLRF